MSSESTSQPLMVHLLELRTRLIRIFVCVIIIFVILVFFSNPIYQFIAKPLIVQLPQGSSMIATDITAPFLTPIKLTAVISFFVAIPYVLFEIWGFIAPALYQHEKKLILPLVISTTFLFYLGVMFAYFLVFPLAFYFLIHTAPSDILINTDISQYLNFVMTLFIIFGVAFEVPVVIILLCWTGVTTVINLKKKRPYILVGIFAIATVVTPPDVLSQILLAIPMYFLFELGIFFVHFYLPQKS